MFMKHKGGSLRKLLAIANFKLAAGVQTFKRSLEVMQWNPPPQSRDERVRGSQFIMAVLFTAILSTKNSIQDVFLLQPFQLNPPELVFTDAVTFFCLDLTVKLTSSSSSSVSILFLFKFNPLSLSSRANAAFLT